MPVSICIYLVFLIVSLKSLFLSTISVTSLILFRISRPTLNQINRINLYRKQVSLSYRIVLLTDICNNVSVGFTKYCVSRSDVINKYPEIKSMGGICRNKSDSFYMWILHSEHYLLWDNNYHLNYKYLWIFDEDVVYTGNIYNFFIKYDKYDEDLITYNYNNKSNHLWDGCVTKEYKQHISRKPIFSATHVHRLSLKMRKTLNKQFVLKRHAQVEQMLIETAIYYKLSIRTFDKKDYDRKKGFGKAITNKTQYYLLFTNNDTKNILYHPVKY